MEEKKLYDDCFFVEEKKYGLWSSFDKDGKGLITALTEESCISGTRFYLKVRQDEANGKVFDVKTYSIKDNYKL